ncbi:hypothetical protein FOCC_FOCC014454 [Frankliniella occidentalis]|nr:hypothetical protein FOCC_FOCC014454 [Frankliniella occidentalis]
MKEELIRDRIIVGITTAPLSAAIHHEENITLHKVVKKVTKAEDVTKQLPTIRNGRSDAATAQVHAAASNYKGQQEAATTVSAISSLMQEMWKDAKPPILPVPGEEQHLWKMQGQRSLDNDVQNEGLRTQRSRGLFCSNCLKALFNSQHK